MAKRMPKPSKPQKVWLSDTWALEIAALVLSIVSLVAIIILLSVYDGKPQFSFGFINLNTVIAILATAFRIGFMVPVGEALAQWKWLWFSRKPRPLGDFDSIDDASRGSRGSLLLLWETKGFSLTAIGAWVAILSLATEPFIQQLVTFRDTVEFQDNSRVRIPFARQWNGGTENGNSPEDISTSSTDGVHTTARISGYGSVRNIQLDQSAQAAVQFGLNSNAPAVAAQLPVTCPSGNCTWPSFLSLAVCSQCSDVSRMLKSAPKTDYPMGWLFPQETSGSLGHGPDKLRTYYLPNGLNINNRVESSSWAADPVVLTTMANLRPSTTLTFGDATTLLFSTSILRVPQPNYPVEAIWPEANATVEAVECGIYLCIKEFNSRVENGILSEDSREVTSTRDPDSFSIAISPCGGAECAFDFRGVTPKIDALYSNETYFPRADLRMTVPSDVSSHNDLKNANVTQAGIDSLSAYIWSLFDEGTFKNVSVHADNFGPCSEDGSSVPCGQLKNVSGMAVGPSGSPDVALTATKFSPAVMEQIWRTPNLTATFENLANSLTNEIRQDHADESLGVTGQLGTLRTVLRVRWEWITLPGVLLIISFAFFLLTVIESSRTATPLWKGSALAVLYHGLETKVRETLDHWDLPSKMDDAAEEVKVMLRRDALHDVLLLRTGPDKTQSMPLMKPSHHRNSSIEDVEDEADDETSIPLAQLHTT